MSTSSSSASDDSSDPDNLSDWTDIVQNVAQYTPHLPLLTLDSSDDPFKRPTSRYSGRRRNFSPSLNSSQDPSDPVRYYGAFATCVNRSHPSGGFSHSPSPCSPSKFYHSEQLIASYASVYGRSSSSSRSMSWLPRKRARLSESSNSSLSDRSDDGFDISGISRLHRTPSPWMEDCFQPRATSTPFVSPPDPRFAQNPNSAIMHINKRPIFRSEDDEAVYYLITKYLMPNAPQQEEPT
ncbi:uncharacterized protein LOC144621056 [Crassostrea virginica]